MKKTFYSALSTILSCLIFLFFISCENFNFEKKPTSYTIIYESEYGTVPSKRTVSIDSRLTEDDLPIISYTKYYFEGWYIGNTKISEGYKIESDITLVAKWDTSKYRIDYILNGGTNNHENPSYYTADSINTEIIIKNPQRTGYDFAGWYFTNDFSDEIVKTLKIKSDFMINLKLYAKWIPTEYTITYILNGGTNSSENPASYNIETDTIILAAPQKEDCVFLGWFSDSDFNSLNITKISKGSHGNKTFYAKWGKECTITYVTENEFVNTDKIKSITVWENTKLTSEQLPVLKSDKDYIFFDGWYDGTTKVNSEDYVVKGNITLTAQWSMYFDESHHVLYQVPSKTLTFDFTQFKDNDLLNKFNFDAYYNGVLTIKQKKQSKTEINKIVLNGSSQSTIKGLCINLEEWTSEATIVLNNISFHSSKEQPLINSPVDLKIEYKGNNNLMSDAKNAISLIQSSNLTLKGSDENSILTLTQNKVQNSTEGAIAIKATNVTIDGGKLTINGNTGKTGTAGDKMSNRKAETGGKGSSGIVASNITIKNNADLTITAGNGGEGGIGTTGAQGDAGKRVTNMNQTGGTGGTGRTGDIGGTGGIGGDAIVGNLIIESNTKRVSLTGGTGGKGGKGGKGGTGGTGGANGWEFSTSGNGGTGGTGGKGGTGGNGGNAISGSLENQLIIKKYYFYIGEGGKGGNAGDGGDGGQPGPTENAAKDFPIAVKTGSWGPSGKKGSPGEDGNQGVQIQK